MTSPAQTERAEALLERLRICAFVATEAARDGDLERLHQAIEEREVLMSRAEPLLARARSGAPTSEAESAARRSLLQTLEAVAQADAQLIIELEGGQREIAASLLELTHDARPNAYQAPPAVGLALDLVR